MAACAIIQAQVVKERRDEVRRWPVSMRCKR
jgi:hypothetical protein